MSERLSQLAAQLASRPTPPHPLDPLSASEIEYVVAVVVKEKGQLNYNAITLSEPKKKDLQAWIAAPGAATRPKRQAEVVALGRNQEVFDGVVDIDDGKIIAWEKLEGVQPLITMEDLQDTESYVRADPKVIEQCKILGITDMSKVYCDPWTIGYDERFGSNIRLQQALMYYRPHIDDCQYAFPLDFCPIINTATKEIIHIDIPSVRRPVNTIPSNYMPADIESTTGYRTDIAPLNITQPEGVSFSLNGREISWQNFKLHIGFNYKEGIVLSNVTFNDHGKVRPLFYRVSLAEMVVPYGNPEHPHQRKHAFDLGEYGGGYMTNSLSLGCDCKGAIHYLNADFVTRSGASHTIPNAICIHEEDAGILFKHTDFRDSSLIVTRGRKLIISQIFTAANYEYCIYWILHQDGTIQLEIKLTGILNTYAMSPDEDTKGWGTQVHPGVNAHNHQHLFCLRLNPEIDGAGGNTVYQVDAMRSPHPVGSEENKYGNGFFAEKTPYKTIRESMQDYNGATSRTWDISNPSSLHPYSGKPATYKLVSREIPGLLPAPGSLVWNRAGFARHAIHVTPYADGQLHPAGRHVPQTSGVPSHGLPEWIEAAEKAGQDKVENGDVVVWHTFGLTHFPAPEDFPVMPAEPMTLLLRPRHFFKRSPVLDVPPSFAVAPSQVKERGGVDNRDRESHAAFAKKEGEKKGGCCKK
ncbi:hypothetical protein EX30DRAFT_310760 [Ascodesmis nigricans]|uniref:Amine oxidase n=1 Tax=Ascodesmis nigricans TaxID=341454 RepID=A0A4S2MLJ5_9PEZI|nr:hypothetical protein EX30DRAFT_310760 [Ascodesmis nigricans]